MFVSSNRGKRSIALDLKQPAALEAVRRLIAGADVLVQNFRPGTMERLGLDEPAMRALNPGLVYVSISGVGETGPYVKKRVYDPVIQSLSGLADVQADQATGRPQMIRTIVADKTTAVHAAQAVCAALVARARTGEGQHIRLSMLDTMIAFLWPEAMTQYTVVGRENAPQPAPRPDLIFKTLDGYITVGSLSDSEWRGLCGVIGRPEWIDDPRFRTPSARSVNAAERLTLVGEILADGHSQDWLDRLDAAEVPCAPVLRRAEVMDNVQVDQQRADRTDGAAVDGHRATASARRSVRSDTGGDWRPGAAHWRAHRRDPGGGRLFRRGDRGDEAVSRGEIGVGRPSPAHSRVNRCPNSPIVMTRRISSDRNPIAAGRRTPGITATSYKFRDDTGEANPMDRVTGTQIDDQNGATWRRASPGKFLI